MVRYRAVAAVGGLWCRGSGVRRCRPRPLRGGSNLGNNRGRAVSTVAPPYTTTAEPVSTTAAPAITVVEDQTSASVTDADPGNESVSGGFLQFRGHLMVAG